MAFSHSGHFSKRSRFAHSLFAVRHQFVQELDFQRYVVRALYVISGYLSGDNYHLRLLALSVET
jgi:hypothetical protein